MQQLYHGATVAIVRSHTKPNPFITMTCNRCPEITENLALGQTVRPDLVARVFRLKLWALIDELLHDGVLGQVVTTCTSSNFRNGGFHTHTFCSFLLLRINHVPQNTLIRLYQLNYLTKTCTLSFMKLLSLVCHMDHVDTTISMHPVW
jgi:hypothetical protein